MHKRRAIFLSLILGSAYAAFAGCGDDESPTGPDADAGNDTSTVDSSGNDSSSTTDAHPDGRSPEFTGSSCATAADCYGSLDAASLEGGEAVCIDKVTGGYCTHKCQADTDCCAVPGECVTGLKQVCASFENSPDKYCFLSCESADINAANDGGFSDGGTGGDDYCHKNASNEFGCRSTGGGQANRKVCFPVGGGDGGGGDGGDAGDAGDASDAADAADADGG